jgi:type II secretory pathway component GspD/PulD (secretin)
LGELGLDGTFNSIVGNDASSLSVAILDGDNDWVGSSAFIQSLSEQVNVIRENKYGGTTLNHTPLPIQVTRDTPYLNVTSTPVGNTANTVVQEFNVIKDTVGISMSLLPVVRDKDSLLVHFNLTDSNQVDVKSFDLGELGSSEVPIKDSRNFIQRAMLKSGQTLVLTGFSQNIDRRSTSSPFHHKAWLPFGSKNKSNQDTDLMIIITPQIIYNN